MSPLGPLILSSRPSTERRLRADRLLERLGPQTSFLQQVFGGGYVCADPVKAMKSSKMRQGLELTAGPRASLGACLLSESARSPQLGLAVPWRGSHLGLFVCDLLPAVEIRSLISWAQLQSAVELRSRCRSKRNPHRRFRHNAQVFPDWYLLDASRQ
jgi:hypothetical protein